MKLVRVSVETPEPELIVRAVKVLRSGELVILPTETVYGLAARADSPKAVEDVYTAKGRKRSSPLTIQVASLKELSSVARDVSKLTRRCLEKFMPGPLTAVLWRAPNVLLSVTAGTDKVGVRIPAHAVPFAVLEAIKIPLVVTSANFSGEHAPTSAQEAARQIGEKVSLVLDGGVCPVGRESTVVDFTVVPPKVLREGAISEAVIREQLSAVREQ